MSQHIASFIRTLLSSGYGTDDILAKMRAVKFPGTRDDIRAIRRGEVLPPLVRKISP